jgi:cyclophilin family peptidyl-prolyl cis-trans isomerase
MAVLKGLRYWALAAAAPGLAAAGAADIKAPPAKPSVSDLVKASAAADWRALDPDNTLVMDIPAGRVVIEMAPAFAPNHVRNIKALVREHYFDGLAIVRSQDNFVVQWGDPNEEKNPRPIKDARAKLKAEFTVPIKNDTSFVRLPDHDGYAPVAGHSNGFPVGHDPKKGEAWLAHCYGMVGVGRDNDADSGGGTSLYAVIGHGPRQLDRNITVVGRVISGMPLLSTLARGAGPLGFYDKPELNVPISSVKLAADLPQAQRPKFEVMRTESATYRAVVEAQRNRGGPWTKVPAGYVDLCNAPIPVRAQQ